MTSLLQTVSAASAVQRPAARSWRVRLAGMLMLVANGAARLPRVCQRLLSPCTIVLEGTALGIMRPEDVEDMVADTYGKYPKFYDPRHYRLPHEARIIPGLKATAAGRKRLLDAFCGQGREALLFATHGFEVTAIDRLEWMIEAGKEFAREQDFRAKFICSDFWDFSPDNVFDIVYTSCWMYSTCQSTELRRRFLQRCADLCADDGMIVLSYVSDREDSKIAALLRFAAARVTAFFTRGNNRSELGERIYTGLFWHHLAESTVSREIDRSGLTTLRILPGQGAEPTFRFLGRRPGGVGP